MTKWHFGNIPLDSADIEEDQRPGGTRQLSPSAMPIIVVPVEEIVEPQNDQIDYDAMYEIAESIAVAPQANPIWLLKLNPGEVEGKGYAVLVGVQRFNACIHAKKPTIEARIFVGDEIEAQLLKLDENLFRKKLRVLEYSEKLVDRFRIATARFNSTGQPVQKSGPGRPQGNLSKLWKFLPVLGRSEGAARKKLKRAIKIDALTPGAKATVKALLLDDNQAALLKVAAAGPSETAQIKSAERLAKLANVAPARPSVGRLGRGVSEDGPQLGLVEHGEEEFEERKEGVEPDEIDGDGDADEQPIPAEPNLAPKEMEITLADWEKLWDQHLRGVWRQTPLTVRQQFFDMLARSRCSAVPDVHEFVVQVFAGREKIKKSKLLRFAKAKGLSSKTVKGYLQGRGYREKRYQKEWHYINPLGKDAKYEPLSVAESLIEAAEEFVAHQQSKPYWWSGVEKPSQPFETGS